jgi:hypothetical protein
MDWDDEFDNGYDQMAHHDPHSHNAIHGEGPAEDLDPLNITNPSSAYLFLSDDAQDEISRSDRKRMKCFSCGHLFTGEIYDRCPECFSLHTEELADETENRYW